MVLKDFIDEWAYKAPWSETEMIEQDLVLSRALIEIFANEFLRTKLAFRGGTAIHKVYILPQSRYSEDIDLVQINEEPLGDVLTELRKVLSFLGKPKLEMGNKMVTFRFGYDSSSFPVQKLKLKIEINCREHFAIMGYLNKEFEIKNGWFSGKCIITTFAIEELLGTKLRALYQRRKGRDLFDIWIACKKVNLDFYKIVDCYKKYMSHSLNKPIPSLREYEQNIENKKVDKDFMGDMNSILSPEINYNIAEAFEVFKNKIFPLL